MLAAALLALCVVGAFLLRKEEVPPPPGDAVTYGELLVHEEAQVQRVAVTLRSGEGWAMVRQADGSFRLEGETDWLVSDSAVTSLLRLTAVISYDDILTEDASAYDPAEFGLDNPLTVSIGYNDGQTATMYIGDVSGLEGETWYYMTVEGDKHLFAVDKGTAEGLSVEQALLHPVVQPTLHKARMAEVTFADGAGNPLAAWALQGEITDDDAAGSWLMTVPHRYPVDAEAMESLRSNLANIRLGAYEGEATPENMIRCGFDTPQFLLTIRQAAGVTNGTAEDGSIVPVSWPESIFTLTVGSAKNDNVYYVLTEGGIYLTSRFSMDALIKMSPLDTVSRFPVMVALANLERLTVTTPAGTDAYAISREARVGADNSLVTDENGEIIYDLTVTKNGESASYAAFEAAYLRMETVRISGILPSGWQQTGAPHTTFTLRTLAGKEHTIALAAFDALHDAVIVDGCALFYLIKGGMTFGME